MTTTEQARHALIDLSMVYPQHSGTFSWAVSEIDSLKAKLAQVEADAAAMRVALTEIASFDEGGVVSGKFDEPHAATRARVTLESLSAELKEGK